MKALIVEDDSTNRMVLQKFLEPHAECRCAVDGKEALQAFKEAFEQGTPYELVCLDIMMPEIDGHAVLKQIREFEEESGVSAPEAAKIIMTTALDNSSNVLGAFRSGCEAYIVKPINKHTLYHEMRKLGLIE